MSWFKEKSLVFFFFWSKTWFRYLNNQFKCTPILRSILTVKQQSSSLASKKHYGIIHLTDTASNNCTDYEVYIEHFRSKWISKTNLKLLQSVKPLIVNEYVCLHFNKWYQLFKLCEWWKLRKRTNYRRESEISKKNSNSFLVCCVDFTIKSKAKAWKYLPPPAHWMC